MSNTSQNKNLIFLVAFLLLTNIAVLGYFLWFKKPETKKPHSDRVGMFIKMLQKDVGFNDVQIEEYKKLKDLRKESGKPLFDEMRKAKENLFALMTDTLASDSSIQAAADQIAARQKALDVQTLNHFKKIRALCNSPEQQAKYDSAVLKMFRDMGKPPKRMEQGKGETK